MAPYHLLCALGALPLLPATLAHMQMLTPSPFRDPHSDRVDEPKDYNILTPLHADGSDFACKGYQWNTPWTTVATYEAGGTYEMTLKGSATHGGGSCQLSLSCDGGINFKVIKSMVGACPLKKQYDFTIPKELAMTSKATCLFAWTWFNKIGNREMYMNCAVVDIVPQQDARRKGPHFPHLAPRDVASANAAAQAALSAYPDLFVANLKNINKCVTKETYNVIFDNPGRTVAFDDGLSGDTEPSYRRGACRGVGLKSTSSAAYSSTGSSGGWSASPGGDDWQWQGKDRQDSQSINANDGQWHPELYANANGRQQVSVPNDNLVPVDVSEGGKVPDAAVEKELDAYLAQLYGKAGAKRGREDPAFRDLDGDRDAVGGHVEAGTTTRVEREDSGDAELEADLDLDDAQSQSPADTQAAQEEDNDSVYDESDDDLEDDDRPEDDQDDYYLYDSIYSRQRRTTRQQRWEAYKPSPVMQRRDNPSTTNAESSVREAVGVVLSNDASFAALIARLNSINEKFVTLVKYASDYLDHPPPVDLNSQGVVLATETVTETEGVGEGVHIPSTSERTPAIITRDEHEAEKHVSMSELLIELNNLEAEVNQLLKSVKSKADSPEGLWSKLKRQLIIPGIIPVAFHNIEPFFFGALVTNGTTGEKAKLSHGTPDLEPGNSTTLVNVFDSGNGTLGCTFNLSLVDRCLSTTDFLETLLVDHEEQPDTASLLDALEWCASADSECQGPDVASIREDGEASMNGNCQSIFLAIGHCLLDDKDVKHIWRSMDLWKLNTLADSPLTDSLYACVQENMFCTVDNTTAPVDAPSQTEIPLATISEEPAPGPTDFNPLVRCDPEDFMCQDKAVAYVAKILAESGYELPTPSSAPEAAPFDPLVRCGREDLACQAQASNQPTQPPTPAPEDSWTDGVFPGLLDARRKPPDEDEDEDAAALFPFFMGPGPVVPPGVSINWPTPGRPNNNNNNNNDNDNDNDNLETIPPLTNDLGPDADDQVRKFFADLQDDGADTNNSSSSPRIPRAFPAAI